MLPFQEAANLNNLGITALIKGDEAQAIYSMTKSIQILKRELVDPNTQVDESTAPNDAIPDLRTVELPQPRSQDGILVFSKAIHIPYDHQSESCDFRIYSVAVIFNLALTHHLHARRTGDSLSQVKASKLYTMVHKLLDGINQLSQTNLLIKLAAINNVAHLMFANGEYEVARLGLSHVEESMTSVDEKLLNEPTVQKLLYSMKLLQAPQIAPAA